MPAESKGPDRQCDDNHQDGCDDGEQRGDRQLGGKEVVAGDRPNEQIAERPPAGLPRDGLTGEQGDHHDQQEGAHRGEGRNREVDPRGGGQIEELDDWGLWEDSP